MLTFLLFCLGLAIVIKSADFLIDGAVALSLKFNVQPLFIGLTVIAFGTSAPELVISVNSALSGDTQLAIGNVIGSNIANILLVLGISSLIQPISISRLIILREIPISLLAVLLIIVTGVHDVLNVGVFFNLLYNTSESVGNLGFFDGIIMLLFMAMFVYFSFFMMRGNNVSDEVKLHKAPIAKSLFLIAASMIGLGLGSKITIESAERIAQNLSLSSNFIGLTMVAIGTSLPEMVTNVRAAMRKQADIAVGNIIGSNIFNLLLVLGATATVAVIPLTGRNLFDMLFLLVATFYLILMVYIFSKNVLSRLEGSLMLSLYAGYIVFLILRG